MRWVHAIGARVGVMWAGRRWGTGSGCRIGRRHRHLDAEPPVSGGARSLRELRVLHPQASAHLEEEATGVKGRVRSSEREYRAGLIPHLGVEGGQRPGLRQACNLPLRVSPDLSEGSAYVDLVVRYRDLEALGSLTAGHVRVEAGHLSAGLGVQRRDVVARCSPDLREVPAYEKRATREHDVEDVWTDIAATADVRIELNVGIAGRTRDLGDLVARFAPDRREVTARIDIVTGNLERSDPARNHAVEGIRVEGLPSPVDEAGNGVQLREIDARLTADRGEVAADVDVIAPDDNRAHVVERIWTPGSGIRIEGGRDPVQVERCNAVSRHPVQEGAVSA